MNVEEFRSQSRQTLEVALNQLQSAMLLLTELETQITDAGRTVQHLTQIVEQFVNVQGNEDASASVVTDTEDDTTPDDLSNR